MQRFGAEEAYPTKLTGSEHVVRDGHRRLAQMALGCCLQHSNDSTSLVTRYHHFSTVHKSSRRDGSYPCYTKPDTYLLELGHLACDLPVRTLGHEYLNFKEKSELAHIEKCTVTSTPNSTSEPLY